MAPRPASTTNNATFTRTSTPNDVLKSCPIEPISMTARNVPVNATNTIAMPAVVENLRTAAPFSSEGSPRSARSSISRPPIHTALATICTHWISRLAAIGGCAPAWLEATSTHIEAVAAIPAAATPAFRMRAGRRQATPTASPVTTIATIRSIAVVPSDVARSALRLILAASRCASMMPATPRAPMTHAPVSIRPVNFGRSRKATRHVAAMPTIPITPMKNSHRAATARIDGGGDTTAFAACALALAADSPTPKA